jgi:hypothetical protein
MLESTNQQHLLLSNNQLRQRSAGTLIKRFMMKKLKEKKREQLEIKSVIVIQSVFRGRKVR